MPRNQNASTSGGLLKFDMEYNSKIAIALSSGEVEYYAFVKASSQSTGMKSMMADFGIKTKIKVITDATAAKGIQ